ncbi:MAG: helix-turn-helix transcriptional regulator [Flavipsychrobacter sp.]|nr:helix-turn-helix transcriptional regulator [Flavipsychrobacter sp.]
MEKRRPYRIKTISELHRLRGLPMPEHPLISVINIEDIIRVDENANHFVLDFYSISIKRTQGVKYKYGQQDYDFDEGVMFFMAPNQVMGLNIGAGLAAPSGWILLIHPDFLWNTALASGIKKYDFFDYSVNEALFLSQKEEDILNNIVKNIQQEYHSNIDKFSKQIIISQIESLLNYSERFYHRQFITREKANDEILDQLDKILTDRFNSSDLICTGLPKVQSICETMNISVSYLSRVLKLLTGQSTQQFIHEKLIAKAKEKLSTTNLAISEIAYELGFAHPQSFSKLFKTKTNLSPLEFRQTFN